MTLMIIDDMDEYNDDDVVFPIARQSVIERILAQLTDV